LRHRGEVDAVHINIILIVSTTSVEEELQLCQASEVAGLKSQLTHGQSCGIVGVLG
jgi:hypothetical protein